MSLSELMTSVLQPIFDLLPRISQRPASNEWGVRDSWLSGVKHFNGPLLHVPVTTHAEYWPKCEVPIDTGLQTLTTADNKTVSVNATLIIKIEDPVVLRSICEWEGYEEWIAMKVRGIVQDVICGHNWRDSIERASDFIELDAADQLMYAGIEVLQLVLEDATEVIPLRILNPYGSSE
jgi:regulator of protease activity HflC (stomatin/prohibitin superfamily)